MDGGVSKPLSQPDISISVSTVERSDGGDGIIFFLLKRDEQGTIYYYKHEYV